MQLRLTVCVLIACSLNKTGRPTLRLNSNISLKKVIKQRHSLFEIRTRNCGNQEDVHEVRPQIADAKLHKNPKVHTGEALQRELVRNSIKYKMERT